MALKWKIDPSNGIEEAIAVYGNVQAFADALGVTRQRVYQLLDAGYVQTRDMAMKIARMTLEKGHPVQPARLMALDNVVLTGGPSNPPRTKKGRGEALKHCLGNRVVPIISSDPSATARRSQAQHVSHRAA